MENMTESVAMDAYFRYKKDEVVPEGDVAVALNVKVKVKVNVNVNVIKQMVRFLKHAIVDFEARLAEIKGGKSRFEIPIECSAIVTVPADVADELLEEVAYYDELFRFENKDVDIKFCGKLIDLPTALVPEEIQDDVINSVEACYNGVFALTPEKTSCNLGVIKTDPEETAVEFVINGKDEEMKRYLASTLQSVFILGGAKVSFSLVTG